MKRIFSLKFLFFLITVLLFIYMSSPINPLDGRMYNFHDETQLARVSQFILNLKNFNFPPRIAPNMSFGLGLPLFNFYAPFSYWITSVFTVFGITLIYALKFSFFIALLLSFIGMFLFCRKFFDYFLSWLGATLY